jgi:integrase
MAAHADSRTDKAGNTIHYVRIFHEGRDEEHHEGINTAKQAEALAKDINRQIGLKKFVIQPKAKKITLQAFGEQWLDANERGTVITTTLARSQNMARYIYPVLGHKLIHTVVRDDIKALLTSLRTEMSDASAKGIIGQLNTMLEAAVEGGYIVSNPASKVRRNVRTRKSKQCKRSMSEPQMKQFLHAVANPTQPKVGPKYDNLDVMESFFMLLARTGIRLGEGFAAQWSAFNWRTQEFTVRMALSKAVGQDRAIWKEPKNGLIRKVDLSDQLSDQLQYLLELRPDADTTSVYNLAPWAKVDWTAYRHTLKAGGDALALLPPGPSPDSLLFPLSDRVFSEATIRRVMAHAVKTLKDGRYTPHELRHSYASLIISEDGSKMKYVQLQLGHASIQETMDTYGHLIPTADRSTVNRLDDVGYVRKSHRGQTVVRPATQGHNRRIRPENMHLLKRTATHDE